MSINDFNILGVEPGASVDEIKKRYRTLLLKFHPDKAKQNGLNPEFASKQTMIINEAYSNIEKNNYYCEVPVPSGPFTTTFPTTFTQVFFGTPMNFDLKETFGDFTNLNSFMQFMEDKDEAEQMREEAKQMASEMDDLAERIDRVSSGVHIQKTKTIDTKHLLQNRYTPSIEIIMYVPWSDVEKQATKSVKFSRTRRCDTCYKNICKVCRGINIINCKKCQQHGFWIKKNCKECVGKGYKREKKKIKVKLVHQDIISYYIYPEDADEKKGFDLPGEVYVKVVAEK